MSALDDYAGLIAAIRRAREVAPDPPSPDEGYDAVIALADELEKLQPDAALGALVRGMPHAGGLLHRHDGDWEYNPGLGKGWRTASTPEAALRQALPEEQDG